MSEKCKHRLFKNNANVIKINREDDFNAEDGVEVETDEIDSVNYRYIGNKLKNLIRNMDWKKTICISQVLIIK